MSGGGGKKFLFNERGFDLLLGHISTNSQSPHDPLQVIIAQSLIGFGNLV